MEDVKLFAFVTIVTVVLVSGLPAVGEGQSSSRHTAEQQIRALTNELVQADLKTDTAFLDKHLSEDYTIVHGDGKKLTKAQEIESFKTADRHYDSFDIREEEIRVYGDTAIVRMLVSLKGTVNGKPFSGDVRTIRIWVKQDGNWRAVAAQATRVASTKP
jgi:ketosteroid isomerase-like protein